MKRLNVKLLVILIVGSVVAIGGSFGLWKFQMYKHSHSALDRAEKAYEEGDMASAMEDLERYLGLNPEDSEQLVRLAMWRTEWLDEGGEVDPRDVYRSLSRAIDVDDDNLELRRRSAEFQMQPGTWQEAVAQWKRVIEIEGEGGTVDSRVSLAKSYFNSDLNDRDKQVYDLMAPVIGLQPDGTLDLDAAEAPETVDAYSLLAALFRDRRLDPETAEVIMRAVIERNPRLAEAHLAYSNYLARTEPLNLDDASHEERRQLSITEAEKAYELDPDSADTILRIAVVNAQAGTPESLAEAETILRDGMEKHPTVTMIYFILAEVESMQGTPEQALEVVKRGLRELPDNLDLVVKRFNIEIQLGDADAAQQTLEKLERLNMPAELRQYYEGEIAFVQQDYAKAKEIYEQVRPMMERDHSIYSNYARVIDTRLWACYEILSMPDMQLATVERMKRYNGSPELVWREAIVWQRMGRGDIAERRLLALMELEEFDDFPFASEVRQQLVQLQATRLMRLPEEQRDWSEVDAFLDEIAPADSEDPAELAFRSAVLRTRGETDEATALLARGIEFDPENENLWLTRIREVAADGEDEEEIAQQRERALRFLDQYESKNGESAATRGTRALILAQIGGEDLQDKLIELESGVEDWDEAQQIALWDSLAGVHLQVKNWRRALELLERIAAARPQMLSGRMRMFDIALSAGDEAAMLSTLGLIEDLVGTADASYKLQEARRQIWLYRNDQGDAESLARARRLMEQVHGDRPHWHANSRYQAELALIEGLNEAAIVYLEEALNYGPRDLAVVQKLAELLIEENRVAEARRLLNGIGKEELNLPLQRLQLVLDADQAEEGASKQPLLDRLDELAPIDSENPNEILFRARMLSGLEDIEGAEAAYRRAVELAPAASTAWMQLVGFLAQQGRLKEAEQAAREAQMRLPETEVPLAMGQMYLYLGNYAWAEMFYKMALDANPESTAAKRTLAAFYLTANRIDRATPYLNEILQSADPEAETTSSDVLWARREVAKIFAARGSYQDYLTAVKLIEENAAEGEPLSDYDLSLLSGLALGRSETRSRTDAIELLEDRNKRNDPMPDGLLLNLAKLYYTTGKVSESRQLTNDLLRRYPENENIIAFYIQILRDENDLSELDRYISRLDNESVTYLELQSQIWAEQGRVNDAIELVEEGLFADGHDIHDYAPEEHGRFRTGAVLLARLGKYDENQYEVAEDLLRQFVNEYQGFVLLLPSFLGDRGGEENLAEAFAIMQEKRGNEVSTIQVTQTAIAVLRANQDTVPTSSHYYTMVDDWFDIGEQESPESRSLVIQRAGFEEMRGDFDAAIELYERSLEMGQLNYQQEALVYNNMAYLMALQGKCEARDLVDKAIELTGPISTLLDTRGMAYLACDQPQMAIADLRRTLLDGDQPVFLYHLALAYDAGENEGQAREKLQGAVDEGLSLYDLLRPEQEQLNRLLEKYDIELQTEE